MLARVTSLLILVAFAGCDHEHPRAKGDEEEEKTAQITVWGERFEIFLEYKFIIAQVPTAFVTHVSDLKTLEPRRKDKVVFVLRQDGGTPVEHVENEPKRAGIYIPELTFPKPGDWTVTLRIPVDGAESVVELPKFNVYATKEEAKKAPEAESPEGISFLKEQQWKVLSKTEPVAKRTLTERLRLTGVVRPRPGSRAAVTPPIAGRLLAPSGKAFPTVGDRVETGQILALVQPPFSEYAVKVVEAEAEAINAKHALEQAEFVLARTKKLASQEAKSEREVQEAQFAVEVARRRHGTAEAVRGVFRKAGVILTSGGDGDGKEGGLPLVALSSPISGLVVEVTGTVGEYVPSDRSVFTVLDIGNVFVEVKLPESDLGRLADSRAALYETPDRPGEYRPLLSEGGGRVVFLGVEVDPVKRTVPLIYELPNSDGRLRIGMALNIYLETAKSQDTLAIPLSAVVEEDGRPIAFVQVSGETFQKRHLTLGARDGGFVQVLSGLEDGERVATKEAYAIRLASVSTAIPAHGHAH